MGKVKKSVIDSITSGIMVFASNPSSDEHARMKKCAVKKYAEVVKQPGLESNDALYSAIRAASVGNNHLFATALRAAKVDIYTVNKKILLS